MAKPEILATRTVHQYRRRDILTYVGLRQYLQSGCAVRDRWAEEVATSILQSRTAASYHKVYQFKEIDEHGAFIYRHLHMPGPNEALAEAALLSECAEAGIEFDPLPCVYSYRLATGHDRRGIFQPYFFGFQERHKAIAKACHARPDAVVLYIDIRKFYPSITVSHAQRIWAEACTESELVPEIRALGERLLVDYGTENDAPTGAILTGPMFSHLIGNLVLHDIDKEMSEALPGRYFRYVDDIVIVALPSELPALEKRIENRLNGLGFELNHGKRMLVEASDWLKGELDFEDAAKPNWMTFVGQMKHLLLFYPDERETLTVLFKDHGIRMHPLDYSDVEQERSYLERTLDLFTQGWFRIKSGKLDPIKVILEGLHLRSIYSEEMRKKLDVFPALEGYERKRMLHKLRFLTTRLAYLADPADLQYFGNALAALPEFTVAGEVFRTLATKDATNLLRYGAQAAQAVAQPLRAMDKKVILGDDWLSAALNHEQRLATLQAYGILRLNGIEITENGQKPLDSPMLKFCDWGDTSVTLLDSEDLFFRELACHHGVDDADANAWALETAFDRDDEMAFDMQQGAAAAASA